MDDIALRSAGGAHAANKTCIAGKDSPPPMPSIILIIIIAI